jgi:hypothetical protein
LGWLPGSVQGALGGHSTSVTAGAGLPEIFPKRMYGPEGWTDSLVETFRPYALPQMRSNRLEFFEVPGSIVEQTKIELDVLTSELGVDLDSALFVDVVVAADGSGLADVTFFGYFILRPRGDERVELSGFKALLPGGDVRLLDSIYKVVGVDVSFMEDTPGGIWVLVSMPRHE